MNDLIRSTSPMSPRVLNSSLENDRRSLRRSTSPSMTEVSDTFLQSGSLPTEFIVSHPSKSDRLCMSPEMPSSKRICSSSYMCASTPCADSPYGAPFGSHSCGSFHMDRNGFFDNSCCALSALSSSHSVLQEIANTLRDMTNFVDSMLSGNCFSQMENTDCAK